MTVAVMLNLPHIGVLAHPGRYRYFVAPFTQIIQSLSLSLCAFGMFASSGGGGNLHLLFEKHNRVTGTVLTKCDCE